MRGKTVCRMHGGTSLGGAASGRYKTGKYSKFLPSRLAEQYHRARIHPELLSVREDLAVAEARLTDLLQRTDRGESGALWQALRTTMTKFQTALAAGELAAMQTHFAMLQQLVTQGNTDVALWREIQGLWETRCKLLLTEQKVVQSQQQMISAEQLMVYVGVMTDAIQRIVPAHTDPNAARAILGALAKEFNRIGVRAHGAEA
jgi:hypothetical protein